jgi:hypothetical protein
LVVYRDPHLELSSRCAPEPLAKHHEIVAVRMEAVEHGLSDQRVLKKGSDPG